jgi:hypothetical protein
MPKPNCTEEIDVGRMDFGRLGRRVVQGCFDGGSMTSDGGVMLLGQVDRKLGLMDAAARCIADPRNPSVSLDPYIDYHTGTMNSPALRHVNLKYRDGTGQIQSRTGDLSDGRHMQMINFGAQYDGEFGEWLVSAKAGYTQGKLDFSAFYSTTNPADGNAFAAGYLARATTAFGAVDHFGYTLAGTNTVYDPYSASGLVMQGQYRDIASDFYSAQGNLSVSKRFETGLGSHDLTAGLYGSLYGQDRFYAYQNYLIEVAGTPRTLARLSDSSMSSGAASSLWAAMAWRQVSERRSAWAGPPAASASAASC